LDWEPEGCRIAATPVVEPTRSERERIEEPMAEAQKAFKPQHHALSRDLGLFPVTMIGVGAMIGAGIFVLTGIAAGVAGPALLLVFLLNGGVALLTAMSYAELGSSLPNAGGGFPWVRESLGGVFGFMGGWMSWFAHATACSLYVLGFGYYFAEALHSLGLGDVLGGFTYKGFALLVAVVFAYVNYRGASETATLGGVITVLKVGVLAAFVVSGIVVIAGKPEWEVAFTPFKPMGWSGILMAMGLTYIAFEGYEVIVQTGEEVKSPEKNIPRAIFVSLAIVVPVYVLVGFAALGAIDPGSITSWQFLAEKQEGAMIEAARQFMPLGFTLLLLGGARGNDLRAERDHLLLISRRVRHGSRQVLAGHFQPRAPEAENAARRRADLRRAHHRHGPGLAN
jgi:amino acid transporter